MPSTLYNSVKQSVVQYAQLKKKNERTQEKLLFRWKLITITFGILFIVLVGLFSQFLKDINNLPDAEGDKTYLVPLLAASNPQTVTTIGHASNLIRAISQTAERNNEHFEYNQAVKIYSETSINYTKLTSAINDRPRLLFMFSHIYNATYTARFGIYAHRGYTGQENKGGLITVKDQGDSKWSSIFNINNQELMLYNNINCFLFQNNGTSLAILEGLTTSGTGLVFETATPECYHTSTAALAFTKLLTLTGIESQSPTTQTVTNIALDVFALALNEQG